MKELIKIQSELHAPKNQRNNFGKYNYRSCEDILEAVKPLLKKYECSLVLTDSIQEIGGILFVEALAEIKKGSEVISVAAQAGINPNRKGMDIAQSFGSSSSYARKYALNGLFLIDDTKDPDTQPPVKDMTKQETIDAIGNSKNMKDLEAIRNDINKHGLGDVANTKSKTF